MKRNLLKLALCAMTLLPLGAWADNVLSARSANGELFYTSWASGLTYGGTMSTTATASENGWYFNYAVGTRSVTCTLANALAEGDIVTIEYYANSSITSGTTVIGLYKTKDDTSSQASLTTSSDIASGNVLMAEYTIPAENGLIGSTTLAIGRGSDKAISVRKVTITRSGADDLRPNTLTGKKTWTFDVYDSMADSKFVNDDLFFSADVTLESTSDMTGHTKTLAFPNTLSAGYCTVANAIRNVMFVVPAGTGEIEVFFASGNGYERKIQYKVGSEDVKESTATTSKSGIIALIPYSVTKETQIWIGGSAAKTNVASITVNPNKKSVAFGTLGYATFGSPCAIDLTEVDNVTAYIATSVGENVVLKSVTGAIPANTGLLLQGPTSGSVDIPFTASASDLSETNLLHAATTSVLSSDYTNVWILTANSANDGVEFNKMVSGSLAAGKAYLVIDDGGTASARSVVFEDGETTGISNVKVVREEGIIYNLNGTRIQNPGKGIYVKDGKKLIVK